METKTILITGATDGIGLETARLLVSQGQNVLIHGRNLTKLEKTAKELGLEDFFEADLSILSNVQSLAEEVASRYKKLDVLINNAGVFTTDRPITEDKLEVRFAVNTIAPYFLTKLLLPLMDKSGRIINLSSAAQSTVNLEALAGKTRGLADSPAYAQSKLALTMWSRSLGLSLKGKGPAIISVNPASMLGSKMVKKAYGVKGGDLSIGANILSRAALSDEFAEASGKYFDNDRGIFGNPHPDALNPVMNEQIVQVLEDILDKKVQRRNK